MEKLGIILLGVGTICAVWSAFMPSLMTIVKFGIIEGTETDKTTLIIAGILATLMSAGIIYAIWRLYFRGK